MNSSATAISLIGLLLITVGLPLWEASVGAWPPARLGQGSFRDGSAQRAIDDGLRRTSSAGALARPWIRTASYALLRRSVPAVVSTGEGWMFFASTIDAPLSDATRTLDADVECVAEFARVIESFGTRLVLIVPPNKATLFPERVRTARPGYRSGYGKLSSALNDAGVFAPDLRAVLKPLGDASYYATDTHWSYVGGGAAARFVAEALQERIGGPLPGTPREGVFQPLGAQAYRGDLHRMLGLRPQSAVDQRLVYEMHPERGVDAATGAPLGRAEGAALVHCGTSFSAPPRFAAALSVACSRDVRDASVVGRRAASGVLDFGYALLDGAIDPPEVLFWELPERMFLTERRRALSGFPAFLAAAWARGVRGAALDLASVVALEGELRGPSSGAGTEWTLTPAPITQRARARVAFREAPEASYLRFSARSEALTETSLLLEGRAPSEFDALLFELTPKAEFQVVTFPLEEAPRSGVELVFAGSAPIELADLEWISQ